MTKSTEERARRACFEECSAGVHLDFEAGCCTVCKSPSECQSWRAYISSVNPTGAKAMTPEQARALWDDYCEAANPNGSNENGEIDLYDIEGMNEAAHALYAALLVAAQEKRHD